MEMPVHTLTADQLQVNIYRTRQLLGAAAGHMVGERMRELLAQQPHVRMIFAAAPSQNEFLQTLSQMEGIDWSRVVVFHMDEYIGLSPDALQRFGRFLCERLFDLVKPGQVHLVDSTGDLAAECQRYADLLRVAPIDIVCLGIGENGHIAFNDPPVADFVDPLLVKPVVLDLAARQQQVHDGCFRHLDLVPTHALTLTIPALLAGKALFCMVPGETKCHAVQQALQGPISTACPASILRQQANCILYLDRDSAALL